MENEQNTYVSSGHGPVTQGCQEREENSLTILTSFFCLILFILQIGGREYLGLCLFSFFLLFLSIYGAVDTNGREEDR